MTTNRREFLHHAAGALSGLAFVGCGLTSPAFSQEALRRREVVVNGKRVRTVDLHAHCHFPEANALLGLKVQFPSLVISPERIKAMDEQGIDIEALSLNPIFWSKAEPDLADQVFKLQNEKLAEICSAQSDRFVGLAPKIFAACEIGAPDFRGTKQPSSLARHVSPMPASVAMVPIFCSCRRNST